MGITNPQVLQFADQGVRPMADTLYKAYFQAKKLILDYNAGNIGSLINTAGAGNPLAQSATDGRNVLVGGDIYNLITAASAFIAYFEGGAVATADRSTVITLPHVNG